MVEEFDALGVPTSDRGALSSEAIRVMRELWTKQRATVQTKNWHFEDVRFFPKPVQQPSIPIWVGGAADGAKRRAATLGDGWHPSGASIEAFVEGCEQVREMAVKAGRDPNALVMSARLGVPIGDVPDHGGSGSRLTGESQQAIDVMSRFREAGCEHVCLSLESGDVAGLEEVMRRFAAEVVPHVR